MLKDLFKVDAVLLERQSMFYFPLTDSLTIFNIRKVIRPYTKLAVYDLKGSALKSILEESKSRIDPDYRLIIAGMTVDGKIDSIPIGDDAVYTVVTTTHLRAGGNGYPQFREGMNEQRTDINALMAVERFLVEKDERIQRAIRPKKWNMVLNLAIGSNFNKQDVNDEKGLYGNALPTQFKNLSDQFFGHIRLGSEGNNFTYKKNKHTITTKFNMVYQRTGTKPIKGPIVYRKATDFVRLDGRYEYDILTLGSRPYMDMTINSIFYSGKGKHPISANISTGFTRKIPKLWLETSIGVNGARNYFSNQNTLGTKTTFSFKKSFPPMSIFTGQTDLSSDTEIFWSPSALAKSEFRHENHNRMNTQLMKKLGLAVGIHTYSYRTTKFRKSAVGIHYDLNLTYGMQWKL